MLDLRLQPFCSDSDTVVRKYLVTFWLSSMTSARLDSASHCNVAELHAIAVCRDDRVNLLSESLRVFRRQFFFCEAAIIFL